MNQKKAKVGVISLGCPKNTVDTEVMLGLLVQDGHQIVEGDASSDVVIINTCSFIKDAQQESVNAILGQLDKNKKVIVTGCLVQQYKQDILKELPQVDGLVGTHNFVNIVDIVNNVTQGNKVAQIEAVPTSIYDDKAPRLRTTLAATAYIKINEGCDHSCTFCRIPQLKGALRSRSLESILAEAQQLAGEGVREVILIGQDTTAYGLDLYKKPMLAKLLKELAHIEDLSWVRLLYAYPSMLSREMLEVMASEPRIAKYLDMPLQHAHPEVLKAMRRPYEGKVQDEKLRLIREMMPEAAIRTTFIVGFPGEREDHFEYLADYVNSYRFDRMGVFTYSREEGTPAAELKNQIPEKVKKQRKSRLMALQQQISAEKNQEQVGKILDVLVEGFDTKSKQYAGRSYRDAPEIDGQVYFQGEAEMGEMAKVKIEKAAEYDLFGHLVQ